MADAICPKCGYQQPEGNAECQKCGIIFRKYAEKQEMEQIEVGSKADWLVKTAIYSCISLGVFLFVLFIALYVIPTLFPDIGTRKYINAIIDLLF